MFLALTGRANARRRDYRTRVGEIVLAARLANVDPAKIPSADDLIGRSGPRKPKSQDQIRAVITQWKQSVRAAPRTRKGG